ncbi:hypothetical protein SynROS8604_01893 [Synechococcus sp. ROS8604]|nr:hypothetical protein SynROS8604_01893 [Synechococcus sp. ROS8604]
MKGWLFDRCFQEAGDEISGLFLCVSVSGTGQTSRKTQKQCIESSLELTDIN